MFRPRANTITNNYRGPVARRDRYRSSSARTRGSVGRLAFADYNVIRRSRTSVCSLQGRGEDRVGCTPRANDALFEQPTRGRKPSRRSCRIREYRSERVSWTPPPPSPPMSVVRLKTTDRNARPKQQENTLFKNEPAIFLKSNRQTVLGRTANVRVNRIRVVHRLLSLDT